jgi:hypothetical protein
MRDLLHRNRTAPAAATIVAALLALPAFAADSGTAAPDFSGPWGRNAFNFEPMPSGPRPLVNLARVPSGTNDPGKLVGDYHNPILKPDAAEIVRRNGEISIAGRGYPDPSNQCRPYAPPFTFAMQLGVEMLQKKDGITMVYNQDDQVRHVRLNAQHPRKVVPSAMGDSVAHYEGDTLVIDTIGIKTGPFTMVDRWGTPHSEALHVIERYRLIDGAEAKEAQDKYEKYDGRVGGVPGAMALEPDTKIKGLQLEVTVEDPNVFTTPWSAFVTYRRLKAEWQEQVCAEGLTTSYYDGMNVGLPKADKPDF